VVSTPFSKFFNYFNLSIPVVTPIATKFISTFCLIFAYDFCKIQELSTLRMIGLAKLRGRLYHLVINKKKWDTSITSTVHASAPTINTTISPSNIWYYSPSPLNSNKTPFKFYTKHLQIFP